MSPGIASIVEGQSEEQSVPVLLRRILSEKLQAHRVSILKPVWQRRHKVVKPGELERAIELVQRTRPNASGILVLLDADDDCPKKMHEDLLARATRATHLPVAVVLAKKEFENWFLGCKEAFRGFMGIPAEAVAPENPEEGNGKGRLERNMSPFPYDTVPLQVRFVAKMDLDLCQERCPSFAKFMRDVKWLVDLAGSPETPPGARRHLRI